MQHFTKPHSQIIIGCIYFLSCGLGIDFPAIYLAGNCSIFDLALIPIFLYFSVTRPIKVSFPAVALFLLFLISLLSIFNSMMRGDSPGIDVGLYSLRWFAYLFIFLFFFNLSLDLKSLVKLLKFFTLGVFVLVLAAWISWWLNPVYYWFDTIPYITSKQFNPNTLGFYLILGLLSALFGSTSENGWRKFLWISVVALFAVTLFLTYSKGTWATALLSCILLIVLSRPRQIFLRSVIVLFLGTSSVVTLTSTDSLIVQSVIARVTRSGESNSQRLQMLKTSFEMGFDRPFLGYGPKSYERNSARYHKLAVARDPHNVYGWLFSELGLGALLLYLFVFFMWLPLRLLPAGIINIVHMPAFGLMLSFMVALALQGFLTGLPASDKTPWIFLAVLAAYMVRALSNFTPISRQLSPGNDRIA